MVPLDSTFKDKLGRMSEKPFDQEDGLSDNPLLFSGEYLFLKKELSHINFTEIVSAQVIMSWAQLQPGLYTRHPESFRLQYSVSWNTVSHDEYLGVLLLGNALSTDQYAKDIVEYGKEHSWIYYDLVPNSDFFKALYSSPISTIKKFIAYKKDYKANPQDTNSVDLRHDGDIASLSYIRQPRDRATYKILAGEKPGILGSLWLSLSTALSTRRDLEDGSRGGTMLLTWFRIKLLESAKNKQIPTIIKLSHKFFDYTLTKKYGARYPEVIANRYFDRVSSVGTKNPIIDLIGQYCDLYGA